MAFGVNNRLTILDLQPRDESAMLVVLHIKEYLISAIVGTSQRRHEASLSGLSQEIGCHMVASQEYANYRYCN